LSAIDKFLFAVVSQQTKKGYFSATSASLRLKALLTLCAMRYALCCSSVCVNLRKSAVKLPYLNLAPFPPLRE
jgi:hypothetical protein